MLRYLFARMNRTISTPTAAADKQAKIKAAEEQPQPSLMDREAWLAVTHVIFVKFLHYENDKFLR